MPPRPLRAVPRPAEHSARSSQGHAPQASLALEAVGRSLFRALRGRGRSRGHWSQWGVESLSALSDSAVTEVRSVAARSGKAALEVLGDLVGGGRRGLQGLLVLVQAAPLVRRFEGEPLVQALPPVMVATIMGTVYFSFVATRTMRVCQAWITWESWGSSEPQSCLDYRGELTSPRMAAFHACFILALVAYHQAVVTDPGGVPDSWREAPGACERLSDQVWERKKSTGALRFCTKEGKYKPDRSHFCTPQHRNVLRMDHYCPWLSNCVGHHNHKYFLLFLFYTVISCDMALYALVQGLWLGDLPAGAVALSVGTCVLVVLLVLLMTPFLGFHLWLLSKNMTTIEFCEQRGGTHGPYRSPYDVGLVGNLRSVLGSHTIIWLLPLGGPEGDGLSWQRLTAADTPGRERASHEPVVAWP